MILPDWVHLTAAGVKLCLALQMPQWEIDGAPDRCFSMVEMLPVTLKSVKIVTCVDGDRDPKCTPEGYHCTDFSTVDIFRSAGGGQMVDRFCTRSAHVTFDLDTNAPKWEEDKP